MNENGEFTSGTAPGEKRQPPAIPGKTSQTNKPAALRILLLEDNPLDARLILETLQAEGLCQELITVDQRAAFEAALNGPGVDLVLADYNVPGFDGLEALAVLRGWNPLLPFIFVTGAVGEERTVETLKRGATDLVLKDHLERLPAAVRRAVAELEEYSRRERAERALRESEEQLRLALEYSNDAVFWADADTGIILRCNRKAEELTERRRDELVGLHQSKLHPPGQNYQQLFREVASLPAAENIEAELLSRSGKRIPVSIGTSVINIGNRRLIQGVFRDVTEPKKAERALREARADLERRVIERTLELSAANQRLHHEIEVRREKEEELREAYDRYRTVADFTYDWEYWRSPQGVLIYCSPSCERVTGYTDAELAGDPELLDRLVHPEDRELWRQHVCETITEGVSKPIQFRIVRKDGSTGWIEHSCRHVTGSRGERLGVRASNRDATARKLVEMETQTLRQELARISRATAAGQLAAALAHELNQPLGAIVCNAQAAGQYLRKAPAAVGQVAEILGDIEADGKRAGDVIHRLRAMYKKDSQERAMLQVNDVIRETVRLLNSEFVIKGVSVELDLEEGLPRAAGSYIQLQQVIINLLVNAMDAMGTLPAGGRRLRISTGGLEEPGTVRVSFCDSGTGLAAEQLGRLGEPFVTTKPNGMGMGLAISRSILEAHGGRLWAENNPEGGATFHVALPAGEAQTV